MVKNILSHNYPQRKNKFKKMVAELWSQTTCNKKSRQILLIKGSAKNNESASWLSQNPQRWNKFQNDYKEEFEEKINLLRELKHKKKDNQVFYLIGAADFIN
ncbi:hypothetical protein [Methanobacterium petrolearium]|uniref:hypothetical protein n=1 Tax=Methanobacterium petrolearium TaxID=710190 RepID=UPI001AE74528|nr:hypothetical protein [Methanobacterium petrolearium]MBP1945161.1 uncharacterized protein YeaO (DUF488 family) [Methanobacterium petrolearium]BDZ71088.1 hypothetical protein GCM10025861_16050 [Methanobacterium petrolearium]